MIVFFVAQLSLSSSFEFSLKPSNLTGGLWVRDGDLEQLSEGYID